MLFGAWNKPLFVFPDLDLLDDATCRDRYRFAGTTMSGQLREIENSCSRSGRQLAMRVRSTF